jgi:type VI secretion system protein ImpA
LLDFDKLLAPLSGDSATGPDLRRQFEPDNPYRRLKDARLAARRLENKAVWEDEATGGRPDWRGVLNAGQEILARVSKDLEVAAWVVEALVRESGYPGARDGFRLCRELIERYWDQLNPLPDPEDTEGDDDRPLRIAALAGLDGEDADGTLIAPLLGISIVDPGGEFGPMGVATYDQAAALEQIGDPAERQKRLEHGAVSMDMVQKAIGQTSASFFGRLLADVSEAQREFESLFSLLGNRCGQAAPSGSNIRRALEQCQLRIKGIAPAGVTATESSGDAAGSPGASRAQVGGPIKSRDQAFEVIRHAAQFFRETEPHSVLSWQLEECVKWGRMSLPDLLAELIPDSSTREAVFKRVGIPNPSPPGG